MADLVITAANVIPVTGYGGTTLLSAGAITQGQLIYNNDGVWALADSDALASAVVAFVALTEATAANQPVLGQSTGDIGFGAILTANECYIASTTAGAIAPIADLGSGDFLTVIGFATTTGNLQMHRYSSGVAKA